jgi:hypothetical protein
MKRQLRNIIVSTLEASETTLDEVDPHSDPHELRIELEHFPKRMNRAGFPCGHESDSRIVLEGRPV